MKSTRTKPGGGFPPSKMPITAIVLTLLGGFAYSPLAAGFFVGFAGIGAVSLQFTVFFLSDMGVIGCVVMMGVRPKRHVAWGVSVLLFSVLAVAVDGYILVNFFEFSGPLGIIWTAPLILVVIGGILAIIWKPPADASTSNINEIVHN
jgi:hypothetical protein